jgi:AbrB family looped-hinge helix DNA binding protein
MPIIYLAAIRWNTLQQCLTLLRAKLPNNRASLRHLTFLTRSSKIYLVNKIYMEADMVIKKGKKFYGSVTVSERGQIVIPSEARRDFDIKTGDKLLVLGDLEKGIALAKSTLVVSMLGGTLEAMRKVESLFKGETNTDE